MMPQGGSKRLKHAEVAALRAPVRKQTASPQLCHSGAQDRGWLRMTCGRSGGQHWKGQFPRQEPEMVPATFHGVATTRSP